MKELFAIGLMVIIGILFLFSLIVFFKGKRDYLMTSVINFFDFICYFILALFSINVIKKDIFYSLYFILFIIVAYKFLKYAIYYGFGVNITISKKVEEYIQNHKRIYIAAFFVGLSCLTFYTFIKENGIQMAMKDGLSFITFFAIIVAIIFFIAIWHFYLTHKETYETPMSLWGFLASTLILIEGVAICLAIYNQIHPKPPYIKIQGIYEKDLSNTHELNESVPEGYVYSYVVDGKKYTIHDSYGFKFYKDNKKVDIIYNEEYPNAGSVVKKSILIAEGLGAILTFALSGFIFYRSTKIIEKEKKELQTV